MATMNQNSNQVNYDREAAFTNRYAKPLKCKYKSYKGFFDNILWERINNHLTENTTSFTNISCSVVKRSGAIYKIASKMYETIPIDQAKKLLYNAIMQVRQDLQYTHAFTGTITLTGKRGDITIILENAATYHITKSVLLPEHRYKRQRSWKSIIDVDIQQEQKMQQLIQ